MNHLRSLLLLVFASGFVLNAQTIQWARQFGSTNSEEAATVAVAPDGVYVAGATFGSIPNFTNAGGRDAFIRKFDVNGNTLWTRQFGTSVSDSIEGLAADATGVYVTGQTFGSLPGQTNAGAGDAYVRKYDPNGNELWTRQFGSSAIELAYGAALDPAGFYVAGFTQGALPGQVSSSPGGNDGFVRKYSPTGTEIWTRQFGTTGNDIVFDIAADSSGVYVAGSTSGALVSPAASTDAFVRKYDSGGNVVWTRQFSSQGTAADVAYAVAVHSSGVYLSGDTTGTFAGQTKAGGTFDSWARKFDLNGNEQWTRQFGTTDNDTSLGIAAAFNSVYIPAYNIAGDARVFRFNLDGTDNGTLALTSNDQEFLYSVATDSTAAYVVGGKDGSTLGQTPAGSSDAFIVKIPHPPSIASAGNAFGGAPLIAPNTWVAIKGTNLSTSNRIWEGPDFVNNLLPVVMDGVTVTVNNKPAYIYFISPAQINILTPPDALPAQVEVKVSNNGVVTNTFTVAAAPQSLSFFEFVSEQGKQYVYGRHASDNSIIGPPGLFPTAPNLTTPVKSGESIYIAATGFGDTNIPIVSGALTQSGTLPLPSPVIKVNGIPATVTFAGLVSVGTYQINFILPANMFDGDLPITATYNGREIQANLFIAVQH